MEAGDVVIALPSSGVHSNGFSLVRKIFDIDHISKEDLTKPREELLGKSLGETLLTPTVIYVKPVMKLLERIKVKGISHITGGGFYENVPRSLPQGLCAKIDKAAIRTPEIFRFLQAAGGIPERDMFNTYNMGVGMALITSRDTADKALETLNGFYLDAYVIGEIIAGEDKVQIC